MAAKHGQLEVVDLFLRNGAQVHHEDQVIRGKGWEVYPSEEIRLVRCLFGIRVKM